MPSSITDKSTSLRPLAITIGEPAGIGPELILRCWQKHYDVAGTPFFAIGATDILAHYNALLGLNIPLKEISDPDQAKDLFRSALPVINIPTSGKITVGEPKTDTAEMVIKAIEMATDFALKEEIAGLVTAPIQKSVLYDAGFRSPGHTEFLAELCSTDSSSPCVSVMMLASEQLKVVPLTIHEALADIPKLITGDLIKDTVKKVYHSLQKDFAVTDPIIAVAGLNPHAGEDGALGREEIDIIIPALDGLRRDGIKLSGPLSADTMFHADARAQYDAAICMFHDQALIPIKTLDFDAGVNVTLGLPIIRTSPDHGTALNIAGQGVASITSMENAITLASKMATNRGRVAQA